MWKLLGVSAVFKCMRNSPWVTLRGGGCKTLLLGQFGDELWGVELLHV